MTSEKIEAAGWDLERELSATRAHEKNIVAEIDGTVNEGALPNLSNDPSSSSASSNSIPVIIPGKAPDRGTTAWLQVVGNWFIFFNSW
jgi:hypothetical protein